MSYGKVKDWRDEIRPGDILIYNGNPRVVRHATYWHGGFLHCVDFVILKCSWTRSATTCVNRVDLKSRKFTPSGKMKTSMALVDKLIARDLLYENRFKRKLFCWDVVGVVS